MRSQKLKKTDDQRYKDFLQLIVEHRGRIYGYILALVPNRTIAEDLLQEVILVMWEKFEQFEVGTNFWAWSCKIAYFKVLGYRTSSSNCPVLFSDDVLGSLAEHYEQDASHPQTSPDSEKVVALENCIKRLSKRDSRIIQLRYLEKQSVAGIARILGGSTSMMYKLMANIHLVLKECVERKMGFEGAGQ